MIFFDLGSGFMSGLERDYIMTVFTIHCFLQSHNDLRQAYEARLASLGVGPEETGFVPVVCRLRTVQLGKGPAGLASIPM